LDKAKVRIIREDRLRKRRELDAFAAKLADPLGDLFEGTLETVQNGAHLHGSCSYDRHGTFLRELSFECEGAGAVGFGGHQITSAAHRLDEIAIRPKCLAEGDDLNSQTAFVDNRAWPNPTYKLIFRNDPTARGQQRVQEVEGPPADAERTAAAEQQSRSGEQSIGSEPEFRCRKVDGAVASADRSALCVDDPSRAAQSVMGGQRPK
jgi:hypothetical protein